MRKDEKLKEEKIINGLLVKKKRERKEKEVEKCHEKIK